MASSTRGEKPPNVVLVLTDDQGYGDLACHGNPILRTPNIDALINASIPGGRAIRASMARLTIGQVDVTQPIADVARQVTFRVGPEPGKMKLQTWLTGDDGTSGGAYFGYVRRIT